MAEENPQVQSDTPKLVFDQESLNTVFDIYGASNPEIPAEEVAGNVARQFIDMFNQEYDTLLTYDEFREKGLSNTDILESFLEDPEGKPIEVGTFFEGAKREAIPAAASVPGFMGGFSLGQSLVSAVPPVSPPTALIKLGVPLVTGTLGAVGTYIIGDEVSKEVLGDPKVILPIHKELYEAGRTATGVATFLTMPFMVKPQLNFGVELAKKKLGDKTTKSAKVAEFMESSVGQMGARARANPIGFGALELASGVGQTGGAYLAESGSPGQTVPRLLYEAGGGISTSVLADLFGTRFLNLVKRGREGVKAVKEGKVGEIAGQFQENRKASAINTIIDLLEANKEDPEAVIRALASDELAEVLITPDGKPIQQTAGLKSGSPTLLALEASLGRQSGGLGTQRKSANVLATRALRTGILAAFASGEPEDIQAASVLMQALFEGDLTKQLDDANRKLLKAFEDLGSPDSRQAQLGENLLKINQQRYDAGRGTEKRLWRSIDGSITINEFFDQDGLPSDTPRFVEFFNEELPSVQEAKDALPNELNPLIKFYKRKKQELGLMGEEEIGAINTGLEKATSLLNKKVLTLDSENRDLLNQFMDTASEMDAERALSFLRNRADTFTNNSRDYDNPRMTRRLGDALDLAANAEAIRRQDLPAEDADGNLGANEVYEMYSTALNAARMLSTGGNENASRLAYGFARSLLDDLDASPSNDVAYNTARAYSRALNDAFTRTYANELLRNDRTGRAKIMPDEVAKRIFSADAGSLRVKQLDMIGQFDLTQAMTTLAELSGNPNLQKTLDRAFAYSRDEETGMMNPVRLNRWLGNNRKSLSKYPEVLSKVEEAVKTTSSIRGTLESMIRQIRAKTIDPETGKTSLPALRKYLADPANQDMLSAMPAFKRDLQNVETAQNLLDENAQKIRERRDDLKDTVSFMDLLPSSTESPTSAAAKAISNNNDKPIKSWNSLLKVVKDAPETWQSGEVVHTKEGAMKGLRTAFIEAVMEKSGGNSFSARTFYDELFTPHRRSKVSLFDWMKSNDVLDEGQADRLKTMATSLVRMESFSVSDNIDLQGFEETVGPMMDFYLRIAGSAAGARMQSLIPGDTGAGTLVAAGAGSKAFRSVYGKVFKDMPEEFKMDVMTEMFENPALLATMLAKGKTEREQQAIAKSLLQKLVNGGFISTTEPVRRAIPPVVRESAEDVDLMDPRGADQMPPNDQGASLNQAPPNLQSVVPPTTQAQALSSAASGSNPPNPNVRTQYASLFPNDPISSMIKQPTQSFRRGGLASLLE